MALKLNLDSLDELDGLIPHIKSMDAGGGAQPSPQPLDIPAGPQPTTPHTTIPSLSPTTEANLASGTHLQPGVGKELYARGLPSVTAQPLTPEHAQQDYAKREYEQMHPWGSEVSPHPGTWGKIAHVASEIGNVAGNTLVPGLMANIPGSSLNTRLNENRDQRQFTQGRENELREAETGQAQAGEELKGQQAELVGAKTGAIEDPQIKVKEDKNAAALAKLGYEKNANGEIEAIPEERLSGDARATRQLHESTVRLRDAQTELALAGNDPNSPKYQLAKAKVDVERQHIQQAAQALGLHEQQFENKKQEQELVKPSGQAQSRGSAARSAIEVMPGLLEQVRRNGAQMGPLVGRLARGEVAIGNVPPEVAQLYSAMKSMYALQPAVHGFRNAEFVKDFEHAVGTLERDPEAFIAGMQGLLPTLQAVAKEGVTYHKREVEGRPSTSEPSSGPPPGAKVRTFNPATGKLE